MKLTILIIGCGDIGVTLGQELLDEGHRVIGVRRQAKALEHTGIEPLALDLSTLEGGRRQRTAPSRLRDLHRQRRPL
ncbi:hypothetical protein HAALTHF_10660n [Vreelandella aquamarina]|nr:hypothetical protein HAALTHF_10660n [Halomonas axialensis]